MESLPPELVALIIEKCDPLDIPNIFLASPLFRVFPAESHAKLYKKHMEATRRDLIFYRRLMRPRQVIRTILEDGQTVRKHVNLTMTEKLERFTTCKVCGAIVVKAKLEFHLQGPWCLHRRKNYKVCQTCSLAKPPSHFYDKVKCIVCNHVGKETITCCHCLQEIQRMYMWCHQCQD